jgi:DNA-binding HxlR family transcriptional regulator
MRKVGLLQRIPQAQKDVHHTYVVTSKGRETSKLIEAIDREYNEIFSKKVWITPRRCLKRIKRSRGLV